MASTSSKPSLRRALDAFFVGFGQTLNVSGALVNRGRYSRGLAGDARALAGDWRRSLHAADRALRRGRGPGAMSKGARKDPERPGTHLRVLRPVALDRPIRSDGQVRQEERFPGAIAVASEQFAGPLPPPHLLAGYEQALPGLAERIVVMAENEGTHRRSLECRLIRLSELGLLSGFTLTLLAIGGFILLAWMGKGLAGLAPLMVSLLSIVTIFVARHDEAPSDTSA